MPRSATLSVQEQHNHDRDYEGLRTHVRETLAGSLASGEPVFRTGAVDLFTSYLAYLPVGVRQVHNCNACRRFLNKVASTVRLDLDGRARPAAFDAGQVPDVYRPAFIAMADAVRRADVVGVMVTRGPEIGTRESEQGWTHFWAPVAPSARFSDPLRSTSQHEAKVLQGKRDLERFISTYRIPVLERAVGLIESGAVNRHERYASPARWILDLAKRVNEPGVTPHGRNKMIWAAAARAPEGYLHVSTNSSMFGVMVQNIVDGRNNNYIVTGWNNMVRSDVFMRPTAAPRAGSIRQAEDVVATLGISASLERREVSVQEVLGMRSVVRWRPRRPMGAPAIPSRAQGVFAGVTPREAAGGSAVRRGAGATPHETMTWARFSSEIMPHAEAIEVVLPHVGTYAGLIGPADPSAPPILRWDGDGQRNPYSWYLYVQPQGNSHPIAGITPEGWSLRAGQAAWVEAVVPLPPEWHGPSGLYEGALLILRGARDAGSPGVCLFPEIVRSELHPHRAVIESYSNNKLLQRIPRTEASAAGLIFQREGKVPPVQILAHLPGSVRAVTVDRWF